LPAEFLGANILDEKPFIMTPYLENGNARHYLQKHPDRDRLQIVRLSNFHVLVLLMFTVYMQLHGISLGLVHLHSHGIIHGDLKAVRLPHLSSYMRMTYDKIDTSQLNVLIDHGGKAILCDFGLSRIKADVTSRTLKPGEGHIVGSHCWMAPERLLGGLLTKPCDIYAFAMTLYEVCY
jgi:serine/threonine protein kinase